MLGYGFVGWTRAKLGVGCCGRCSFLSRRRGMRYSVVFSRRPPPPPVGGGLSVLGSFPSEPGRLLFLVGRVFLATLVLGGANCQALVPPAGGLSWHDIAVFLGCFAGAVSWLVTDGVHRFRKKYRCGRPHLVWPLEDPSNTTVAIALERPFSSNVARECH